MGEHWLLGGLAALAASTLASWRLQQGRTQFLRLVFALLAAGVTAVGVAIALRWAETGYGPFLTLHEVLVSNVLSLGAFIAIAYWLAPQSRLGVMYATPVVLLLGLWALTVTAEPAQLPATFDSPWLWLHVGFGKIFLGALLVALGMAVAGLTGFARSAPGEIDASVWRFASLAFVFDSAMLLTGAMWANDAWGRYWNWDPVETWALVTWLALGLCLHARVTWAVPTRAGWAMIVGVFVLAFLTLFGMPFLSLGPHKGIV